MRQSKYFVKYLCLGTTEYMQLIILIKDGLPMRKKRHSVIISRESGGSELLSFLALSEKRKNLILYLLDGARTLQEIKDSLGVTSSGIIPQIRKMEDRNLILQDDKRYRLTEIGTLIALSFEQLAKNVDVVEKYEGFWIDHKISGLPREFLLRFYELGNIEIYESSPTELFKAHEEYMKLLLNSKVVKGLSPVLHPEYPETILALAERGIDVEINVTKVVLDKIMEEHRTTLAKGLSYNNAKLYVTDEEIPIAFTVTDTFFSMRLFLHDGTYDFYRNVISQDPSAIKWGRDLFDLYLKKSRRVTKEDFLNLLSGPIRHES